MMEQQKPKVNFTKAHGNVYNLLSICVKALKDAGQPDQAYQQCAKDLLSLSHANHTHKTSSLNP